MTSVNDYVFTLIVQVSVISLLSLTLTALSLHSPAKRHALGVLGLMLVLSSPLVTLLLPEMNWWRWAFLGSEEESPIALSSREITPAMPVQPSMNEARPVHIEESETLTDPVTQPSPLDTAIAATPESSSDAPRQVTVHTDEVPHRGWAWRTWLVILAGFVWITGSAVSAGLWIWRRRQLRRLARSLRLVDGPLLFGAREWSDGGSGNFLAIAREVCEAVGIRKLPPIAISQVMPMPLVLGLWRPIIVIPCELLRTGAEARLRDVLIHEAAHVARRDAWIGVAQRLASVLWWWHPAVLVLNRTITRSREEVCDNFVLSRSDSSQYANTLLELSERCAQMGRIVPSLGLFESHWTLEARIRGLLKPGREMMTRTKRRALAVITVILGTACFLIGGVRAVEFENTSPKQSKEEDPSVAAAKPPAKAESVTKLRRVVVRGQCVDDQAKPLAAVRVLIVRRSEDYRSQVSVGETKSDAAGRFELRNVETAMLDHGDLFAVAALKGYVSACVPLANPEVAMIEQELKLSSNPGTLSGMVSDPEGRPIPGVTVFLSCCVSDEPLPGILSSVTDENGRYAITDLKRWTPESTRTFDPTTGTGTMVTSGNFLLRHPDYPTSMARHSAVPQEVNVTLYPPAIVEGRVIDAVTNQPAANVTVSAQGVARSGWHQTRTDAQGRYRLRMTRDHYNIWAQAEDRIAIAVKALRAERGQTASNADIRLVRGGFVVGTVFGADGKPISPTKESDLRVAHYGPARPRTGAAVTSTLVQPAGTYRLRVAPGRNYVYSMSGSGTSGYVTVEEGKEVTFDIHLGLANK
ncbi:MAG: M56 family metallopeptidase [Pirellulales bacterium]